MEVPRYIRCKLGFKIMGDIYDGRPCAIPFTSLDMTDRPRHRVMIEYNPIEIAFAENCPEVLRVIAYAEPSDSDWQCTSQRKDGRNLPARHNDPINPTLERFCDR